MSIVRYCTRTHLVEIEHQIQLAHVPKERIQHLDEEVYGLEVRELVIVGVDAGAEEQPRVPPVDDLARLPELDEVGLVLLVARRNQAVHLRWVRERSRWESTRESLRSERGESMACQHGGRLRGMERTSPFNFTFSSSWRSS